MQKDSISQLEGTQCIDIWKNQTNIHHTQSDQAISDPKLSNYHYMQILNSSSSK